MAGPSGTFWARPSLSRPKVDAEGKDSPASYRCHAKRDSRRRTIAQSVSL
jgi:hypothetical protein